MSAADNDMADKHGMAPRGRLAEATRTPAYLLNSVEPLDPNVPLSIGMVVGSLSRPETHAWFLAHGVTDVEITAAHEAIMKLARAFYRRKS